MATDPSGLIAQLLSPQGVNGFQAGQDQALQRQAAQQQLQAGAMQLQQAQQQQAQAQQYQQDVNSWIQGGSKPDGLVALATRYPDQAKNLQASWKLKDDAQTKGDQTFYGQVYNAVNNGRTDLATNLLQQRQQALKGAGQDTSSIDDTLQDLATNPDTALGHIKSYALSQIYASDPDGFAKAFGLGKDTDKGQVVGRAIGHYDNGKFVLDYRDPDPTHVNVVDDTDENGNPVKRLVQSGGTGGFYAGGQAPNPSGGSAAPLSVRLNNPGAIRANPNNNWQGQVGSQDGFVQFDTPENGARAHRVLIANQVKAGFDTPATWAAHYAPASDGNDPAAYAQTIAKGLGIGVNDKIPLSAVPKVAALSAQVESGGSPSPSPSPATPGGAQVIFTGKKGENQDLDPDTITAMAQQYRAGDKTVLQNLGRGQQGASNIVKLRQEITRQNKDAGLTGSDQAAQMAEYAGDVAAQRAAGTRLAQVELAANEAKRLAPIALRTSAIMDRSGFLPLAKVQQAIANGSNDPKYRAFNAANNALVNAYSRAVSPSGAPTVADKQHAYDLLNTAFDKPSYEATVNQMLTEIDAALKAPHDVRAGLRAAVTGRGDPTGAPPAVAPPPGSRQVGTYQGRPVFQLPNGKRVVAQ